MTHLHYLKAWQEAVTVPPVAGYFAWYDASDASSITESGGAVSQWNDKSGNANHLTASGTAKPTTGTRTINALNALDFDGTDDVMAVTYGATRTADRTIFFVFALDDSTISGVLIDNDSSSYTQAAYYEGNAGVRKWSINAGGGGVASSLAGDTSAHVLVYKFRAAANERIYGDATSVLDSAAGTNVTMSGLRVGDIRAHLAGGYYLNGRLAELIIYESDLSDANRNSVEAYLKAKWATP